MISVAHLLFLSLSLFALGAAGFVMRKNALSMLICLELMLSAATMAFVTFSRMHQNETGNILYFLIITVAACESAVGLALILNIFRLKRSIRLSDMRSLEG